MNRFNALVVTLGLIASLSRLAAAQDAAKPPEAPPVAVVINGEPIYLAELESRLKALAQTRRISPDRADRARAELLKQLIHRRLALQVIARDKNLVKQEEVDQRISEIESQLKQQQVSLDQYCRARGVTPDTLRKDVLWQLGWQRYLDLNLADELERYFKEHEKDLNGTVVRASHILLRPERYNESEDQIHARANKIREEIESGKLSFADAAKKYSMGPSGEKGGDLGAFPRRGVMAEEFSKAAYALEKGQISKPVSTTFGTHLIMVTDVQPGNKQWTEVVSQIRPLASVDMFDRLVAQAEKDSKIEFTGLTPYFKPGTEELVVPKPPEAAPAKAPAR